MTGNPDITALVHNSMPLCATLGIAGIAGDASKVILELDFDERLCTSGHAMHGGALMALADSAGGLCAFFNLPEGAVGTATIESKTNFFGAVTAGRVRATAAPLHVGSTTIVVETDLRCNDRLIAKTTQSQIVRRPRESA